MYCCVTWQFMKNFSDSNSYRVEGLFGILGYLDDVLSFARRGLAYI